MRKQGENDTHSRLSRRAGRRGGSRHLLVAPRSSTSGISKKRLVRQKCTRCPFQRIAPTAFSVRTGAGRRPTSMRGCARPSLPSPRWIRRPASHGFRVISRMERGVTDTAHCSRCRNWISAIVWSLRGDAKGSRPGGGAVRVLHRGGMASGPTASLVGDSRRRHRSGVSASGQSSRWCLSERDGLARVGHGVTAHCFAWLKEWASHSLRMG